MHPREVWEQVLVKLEPQIQRSHFITWFRNTAILEMDEKRVMIGVPTVYAYDWLANRYRQEIFREIQEFIPQLDEILFEVHSSLDHGIDDRVVDLKKLFRSKHKSVRKLPRQQEVRLAEGISSKLLNPRYTLDNFVVGSSNRLAHAACMAVVGAFGRDNKYNPLFVYGGVGLGKTHLLQATGNEILRRDNNKIVVYVPSERFVNEIVDAIARRSTKQFRDRYRKVDCLIFDDVQFLARKEQTQAEFFNTFNDLHDGNKQIIISSDRPPKELTELHDRLRNRFQMGMMVDVSLPDYETRLAILYTHARELQALIPQEVLEFIALNISDSIRELEGVLLQAVAQQELQHETVTVESVAHLIRKLNRDTDLIGVELPEPSKPRAYTIKDVIQSVADYYQLSSNDIIGDIRRKEIMLPRQISMYLIRKELSQSYERIGAEFGGRNHTTVMHACEKISRELRRDRKLTSDMSVIRKEMGLS